MAIKGGADKNLRDFTLQVPLLDQGNAPIGHHNPIILEPRYTDGSTAANKTFTADGDYADASNHNSKTTGWSYDLKLDWANSGQEWYNYTYDTNSGRRGSSSSPSNATSLDDYGNYISLYMDLAIGTGPHPGVGTAYAHMAILQDAAGGYFAYQYTAPPPVNYTQARTFPDQGHHNIKLAGQNYGEHHYRQWFCLADVQSWTASNAGTLRFINWGGGSITYSRVTIRGGAFLIHGKAGASSGADQ
jgi:hypothetical protein